LVRRELVVSSRLAENYDWPGLAQVCQLTRTTKQAGKETVEVVHAITSLPRQIADAATLLPFWRGHWRVETLHYFRDVHFGEDHCRVRDPTGGHALACFRNVALNLLRRNQANGVIDALRQFTFRPASLLKFLRILKQ
jgi:predicted transposase YbfD/YdcC